jgi:hypothetical protein
MYRRARACCKPGASLCCCEGRAAAARSWLHFATSDKAVPEDTQELCTPMWGFPTLQRCAMLSTRASPTYMFANIRALSDCALARRGYLSAHESTNPCYSGFCQRLATATRRERAQLRRAPQAWREALRLKPCMQWKAAASGPAVATQAKVGTVGAASERPRACACASERARLLTLPRAPCLALALALSSARSRGLRMSGMCVPQPCGQKRQRRGAAPPRRACHRASHAGETRQPRRQRR